MKQLIKVTLDKQIYLSKIDLKSLIGKLHSIKKEEE